MNGSHRLLQELARLATGAAPVLAGLGVIAVITGTALYDTGAPLFSVWVNIAILAGEVGLGLNPSVRRRSSRCRDSGDGS